MKPFKMDLMDWKAIERDTESQYRGSLISSFIASVLNDLAVKEIKKLGGKTNEEEDLEAKKEIKKST